MERELRKILSHFGDGTGLLKPYGYKHKPRKQDEHKHHAHSIHTFSRWNSASSSASALSGPWLVKRR